MLASRFLLAASALAVLSLGFALGPQKTRVLQKPKGKGVGIPYSSVAPIFKNCAMCHSGARPKHGLDLTTYANVMKGDKEGKVVIAGKPTDSRLSKAVHRKGAAPMPPMAPLSAGDVAKIDAWIKAGAKS